MLKSFIRGWLFGAGFILAVITVLMWLQQIINWAVSQQVAPGGGFSV